MEIWKTSKQQTTNHGEGNDDQQPKSHELTQINNHLLHHLKEWAESLCYSKQETQLKPSEQADEGHQVIEMIVTYISTHFFIFLTASTMDVIHHVEHEVLFSSIIMFLPVIVSIILLEPIPIVNPHYNQYKQEKFNNFRWVQASHFSSRFM